MNWLLKITRIVRIAALSVLILGCLATVLLWGWTGRHHLDLRTRRNQDDDWKYRAPDDGLVATSGSLHIWFSWKLPSAGNQVMLSPRPSFDWKFGPFSTSLERINPQFPFGVQPTWVNGSWQITVPPGTTGPQLACLHVRIHLWFLAVLFATYPLVLLIRGPGRRAYRYRRGCCISCGYDLRGTLSPFCSECGTQRRVQTEDA